MAVNRTRQAVFGVGADVYQNLLTRQNLLGISQQRQHNRKLGFAQRQWHVIPYQTHLRIIIAPLAACQRFGKIVRQMDRRCGRARYK